MGKAPPWEQWKPYCGFTLEEGWYHCEDDLTEVRDEYLRQGHVPRQSLSDCTVIRKLTIGKTVIQRVAAGWHEIKAFAEGLGMPWAGEGLPGTCQKALLYFLRPKREGCKKFYKTLLERQGGGCAECGSQGDCVLHQHRDPGLSAILVPDFLVWRHRRVLERRCRQINI